MDEYGTNAYDYDYGYDSHDNYDSYEEPVYNDHVYTKDTDHYMERDNKYMQNGWHEDEYEAPEEHPHGWGWAHEADDAPAW